MLELRNIETGYGKKQVLFDVTMHVNQGEIVAIIGPNGSGKSTLLKVVCGLIPAWKGEILYQNDRINGFSPAKNVSRGITFAPQGNRVFHGLSVLENLQIGGFQLSRKELKEGIEKAMEMFPVLRERSRQDAGKLSGGEQQQLALARALMPKPKLLMLDEPSLGLAPGLQESVFQTIAGIGRENGPAILIVEQKVREVLSICDRVYSLKLGKVAFDGRPQELKDNSGKLKELFL